MKKVFTVSEYINDSGVVKFEWQKTNGNFLAVYGSFQRLSIFDRHGEHVNNIELEGKCEGIDWEQQGDVLAIIDNKVHWVYLWDVYQESVSKIDTGFKDILSLVIWSKFNSLLAVGTSKGNLLLYNHLTSAKIPILGKHSRRITCGAWSEEGLLILGSEDKTFSVSDEQGELLKQMNVRDQISNLQLSEIKDDERSSLKGNTISCILGKKSLYLFKLTDDGNPTELTFEEKYGEIVDYKWYGDGYVMLGFSNGYSVVISTHKKEIGHELHKSQDYKDRLNSIGISFSLGRAVTMGDHCVKFHDLTNLNELVAIIELENDDSSPGNCRWSEDGQLLAVSTSSGQLYVFLTRLPMLASLSPTRDQVAYLTSLREVTVEKLSDQNKSTKPLVLQIELEPKFLAIGPNYLAVGMNNQVWFYEITNFKDYRIVAEQEYMKTIGNLQINSHYCAVWYAGKLMLHMIQNNQQSDNGRSRKSFPEQSSSGEYINSFELTSNFLVFSSDKGHLNIFSIEDWNYICEFKHHCGIQKIFSSDNACTIIFMDSKSNAYLFSPFDETIFEIQDFPLSTNKILWDSKIDESGLLLVCTDDRLYTYVLHNFYINIQTPTATSISSGSVAAGGDTSGLSIGGGYRDEKLTEETETQNMSVINVVSVGFTKVPFGHKPLYLRDGDITLLNQNGKLVTNILGTHSFRLSLNKLNSLSEDELMKIFQQAIKVNHLKAAWKIAEFSKNPSHWNTLGEAALKCLDINFAIRTYRKLGNVGMVFSLLKINNLEDQHLVGGYVALFLGDFDLAQALFLNSSKPITALDMRRDLLHWDSALQLAQVLSPSQIPFISRDYASQLEFIGDYLNAKLYYERGLSYNDGVNQHTSVESGDDTTSELSDHIRACTTGIARMSLRLGDTKKGISMAEKSNDKVLMKECAFILEQIKQYAEAAQLYEKAGYYEKAINVYVKLKNWNKVGELLNHTTSPKWHIVYAKARESEGLYSNAVAAYEIAKDYDSVIRINLEYLKNVDEAVRIVQTTKSREGANLIAKYYISKGSFANAIEFLVMSNCLNEAFRLAKDNGQMETYAKIIGPDASMEDYLKIATYFEHQNSHYNAGKFYLLSSKYEKAIKHLLNVPYEEEGPNPAMDLAVQVIGRAQDDKLTQLLVKYLLGEIDGIPKNMRYLFQMYMALKQFRDAARTAILLARDEQSNGNYRTAHDLLFGMMKQLKEAGIRVPSELSSGLMLLHSYIIAKVHIKRGDHLKGARMLIRVAESISKFPSHVVPILTSTVIECHRSGLRESSFRYAAMLLRPEYRDKVDPKYLKKMENIIRKPDRSQEEEPETPCPFCSNRALPETQLQCHDCKTNVPYCIATGRHVIKDDLVICPQCEFPAIGSELRSLLSDEDPTCPMCSEQITPDQLKSIIDINQYVESCNQGAE